MTNHSSVLPLIVGFGGFNAAGRSSGHQAYSRMVLESLGVNERNQTIAGLSALMGLKGADEEAVLSGTLVRRLETRFFDPEAAPGVKKLAPMDAVKGVNQYLVSGKELPKPLPAGWTAEPLDEGGKQFRVTLPQEQAVFVEHNTPMAVQAAGQLPTGFEPGDHYRSQHHPRGLQMSILGASDAVKSMGLAWSEIVQLVTPDQIAVYSSSVMSQLDATGFGGMMQARQRGVRPTSKQLAMGLNTMPADFINAYVLGSLGATAGIAGACATFLYNLRQGVEDIRSGRRKVVIVGSAEAPIVPEVMDGYAAMSALATDTNLMKLDGVATPDYRRASRPFGDNCGFTLAESSQYVVLMADDLALELGAQVFGAVPGVYVNADGYKKSISAPGAGNYITMAKAVGLAQTLVGEQVVKHQSFVQAHGSSTPQNRVTESRIFDRVAEAFGIESWPVAAVKSYVGHSLGPASGDQLATSLGIFAKGIVPGVKTIAKVADDVFAQRLSIGLNDQNVGVENCSVAFLNSKGFGGNNATATVFSPSIANGYLLKKYGKERFATYSSAQEKTTAAAQSYLDEADKGALNPIYEFGNNIVDEEKIQIQRDSIRIPGFEFEIPLLNDEGYGEF